MAESLKNEKMILDISFSDMEVMDAVAKLKEGKSAGSSLDFDLDRLLK